MRNLKDWRSGLSLQTAIPTYLPFFFLLKSAMILAGFSLKASRQPEQQTDRKSTRLNSSH